jgi:hypothetical protein
VVDYRTRDFLDLAGVSNDVFTCSTDLPINLLLVHTRTLRVHTCIPTTDLLTSKIISPDTCKSCST